jgi:hypothetical protein
MESIVKYRHGVKSYEIIRKLLGYIYAGKPLNIVDLTYGVGRFYRSSKSMIGRIIAVDITKYDWEVEPNIFYLMDCRVFVDMVIRGEIKLGDVDVIVVDPPWSHEKRGVKPRRTGISGQPYHISGVYSKSIVQVAIRLSRALRRPLLYRYKGPLECNHRVLVATEVRMMYNAGYVYYGICNEV